MLKIGDRVKCIKPETCSGKEAVVITLPYNLDDYMAVDIHINGSYEMTCPVDWVELIEPATIQKGSKKNV